MEKFTLDYEVNAKNLIDFFGYTKLIDYIKMDNESYPIFPRLSDITKDVENIGWASTPFKTCGQIVYSEYQFTLHVDFPREVEEMNRMETLKRYLETFIKSFNSGLDEHIIKELQESALTVSLEKAKQTKVKQNSTIISPDLMEKPDGKSFGVGGRSVSYLLEDKSFIVSNNLDQLNYYVYSDTIHVIRNLDRISILGDLKIGFNLDGFQLYRIEEKEEE